MRVPTDVPRGPEHLVVRAMEAAFAHVGARPTGIRLTCTNAIPHARGLGSSSAAIVGGLALGGHLVGQPLDERDLLVLATKLEGHPDNVAAAIHGGFTIAWTEPTGPQVLRLDAQLPVTVLVPPTPVSTDMARRLLPARVPHADAASNAGRAALLVAALQGRPELLMAATEDLLHQPYRAEAMPQSYELVQELRAVDVAAVISGAGPTVLGVRARACRCRMAGWPTNSTSTRTAFKPADTGPVVHTRGSLTSDPLKGAARDLDSGVLLDEVAPVEPGVWLTLATWHVGTKRCIEFAEDRVVLPEQGQERLVPPAQGVPCLSHRRGAPRRRSGAGARPRPRRSSRRSRSRAGRRTARVVYAKSPWWALPAQVVNALCTGSDCQRIRAAR